MRKQKGFTLMELLVVISVLSIILVISIPTIIGQLNKSKEKAKENQINFIIDGAKKYVAQVYSDLIWQEDGDVKKAEVTLKELYEQGYMDLPIIDPITNEAYDPETTMVVVYKDANDNISFEYVDINTGIVLLVNNIKKQYISSSTQYNYANGVYGLDGTTDISSEIIYECKYGNEIIECSTLQSTQKQTGIYTITYKLRNKVSSRELIVVSASQPTIILRPKDDGATKVDSIKVTIEYPQKSTNKK